MTKGRTAPALALLGALAAAGPAPRADEAGCAALAERVKHAVAAVARNRGLSLHESGTGGSGGRLLPAPAGRYTCSVTAAVASRAFAEALHGSNVRLARGGDWLRAGDHCLGHHLDQCYPSHDPLSPLPPPSGFAFVHPAWRGVTRALASQMPYGIGGDLSSFSDTSLDAALSAELQASFGRAQGTGEGARRR